MFQTNDEGLAGDAEQQLTGSQEHAIVEFGPVTIEHRQRVASDSRPETTIECRTATLLLDRPLQYLYTSPPTQRRNRILQIVGIQTLHHQPRTNRYNQVELDCSGQL